jgi:hypothetical protein
MTIVRSTYRRIWTEADPTASVTNNNICALDTANSALGLVLLNKSFIFKFNLSYRLYKRI